MFQLYKLIGIVGSILIVISWLPQIFRLIKTKSSKDFSIHFLFVVLLGSILLAIYSACINNLIFILLNTIAALDTLVVLVLVVHYRR